MRRAVFTAFFLCLMTSDLLAAAWVKNKGEGQFINSLFHYTTKSYSDSSGNRVKQDRFSKIDYNPYLEYGLSDSVTLGLSPSFQYLRQNGVNNLGLADTEIFARKKIWSNDNSVFSIQPLIKLFGPYSEYDALALGKKQVDIEFRTLYGKSFELFGEDMFVNFETAYRKRMEAPSDELRFDVGVGMKRVGGMFLFQSFNIITLGDKATLSNEIVNSSDFNMSKLQFSVVEDINDKVSVQLGIFKNVWAENTGGGGGILFSVWLNF